MAMGLILEFAGLGLEQYEAVNRELGIDVSTGEGDWPDGMLSHAGGMAEAGLVVMEVWDTQEDQNQFMEDRLGPALQAAGVTGPPSRMEWVNLAAYHTAAPSPA
jgi:hypothetical protein